MRLLLFFALLPILSAAAAESPTCTFVVGHGTQDADSTVRPYAIKPSWFIVTGRAEIEVRGTTLKARFFDSRLDGDLSHTFEARLAKVVRPGRNYQSATTGTLKTMYTDSGDDLLKGSMVIAIDSAGSNAGVWQSLVVQNANSFVGIACYAKSAA